MSRLDSKFYFARLITLLIILPNVQAQDGPNSRLWEPIDEMADTERFLNRVLRRSQVNITRSEDRDLLKEDLPRLVRYAEFNLDSGALTEVLATLDSQNRPDGPETQVRTVEMTVPLPDGSVSMFVVRPSSVLSPNLAEKYPQMRTYEGTSMGIEVPMSLRFEVSPAGFHAQIQGVGIGTVMVNPMERDVDYLRTKSLYASYLVDEPPDPDYLLCETKGVASFPTIQRTAPLPEVRWGDTLRVYRLAVAATGEYVAAVGGTTELALEAIISTINRVNSIYERELSVRLELVGDNDKIIFTNPATDGMDNDNANRLINQSQTIIDREIGNKNYDIGHTFSTGAGGLAGLGVVTVSGQKARGVTGRVDPRGDGYDVDYVAHEIGHQFGANHTFNGYGGSCSPLTRNAATAYEPGSGYTIQAYAGICNNNNLRPNSYPYFHTVSLYEITRFITNSGEPQQRIPTSNTLPTVNAGQDRAIPVRTPFYLSAVALDNDPGSHLTYSWEALDLGPQADLNAIDDGNIPLFSSGPPQIRDTREFTINPAYPGGLQSRLPVITRMSAFRVTVRDNQRTGAISSDSVQVQFEGTAGPFVLIEPTTGSLISGRTLVRWDVANTNLPPVSVSEVRITLSDNAGGKIILADKTTNDGEHEVNLPASPFPMSLRVESVTNSFFAESDPLTIR